MDKEWIEQLFDVDVQESMRAEYAHSLHLTDEEIRELLADQELKEDDAIGFEIPEANLVIED